VYFDPPYAPFSSTSRFTSSTAASFTDADQEALQRLAVALSSRGCHVGVSNSSAPLVTDLMVARRTGSGPAHPPCSGPPDYHLSRPAARQIEEFIISNVNPVAGHYE
jgi:hypothetical protein